jgi:MoaA/NifB/PqqE/SkfB family radical SAM enzyme
MTPGDIDRILAELPGLRSVKFQGLGEPLLTQDIDALLEKFRFRDIRLWTISNGTLLGAARNRERLIKNFRDVSISIDSADPALFRRLRPPANLDMVIDNTRALVADRNARGSNLAIGITFCVGAENLGEIDALGPLALQMGVDYVSIGLVENWTVAGDANHAGFKALARAAFDRRTEIAGKLSTLRRRLLTRGVLVGRNRWEERLGDCQWPFSSAFINVEGEVTPCCLRSQRTHSLGNIFRAPMREIWNGPGYRALRGEHLVKDHQSRLCGACPL